MSPSSTRAASRTRPSESRGRRPSRPRARMGACMSPAARRTSPPTPSPAYRRTSPSSPAEAKRRRRSSRATSVRSAACRRMRGSTVCAPSSRSRTAAASRATSASSRSCAALHAAVRPARCSRRSHRRVAQGHREIVLTGINLGCYRDREAGYELPRLVREVGAVPGLEAAPPVVDRGQPRRRGARRARCARRRRSAATCTCRCSRATTACCAPWARRYTAATYLRRLEPLEEFNLTTDAIVGFPTEDDAAFERTLARRRRCAA